MNRLLLGVIGHVDHGKSALVRALTGMVTDRLPEEQRRGISIALGFAHLRVGDAEIDLVDMPGHERFVRTMISGATGIDAVLLVVAANEGVKPQTVEHVNIAGLLGVRRAIVAVSKTDLVPPDQARAVAQDALSLATAAGLAAPAPILTSAELGQGVDALQRAFADLVGRVRRPDDDGFFYLPVDRAFSLAGHGTVVTGTLRHGELTALDEVELLPTATAARIRRLQVHGSAVTAAAPGQRVAVNLRGLEPGEVPRGMALAPRGLLHASSWLSAQVRSVADGPALRNGARLRLLVGTAETDARLRLLDRDELAPGETAPAQLRCAVPVAVPAREPFILRIHSPALTVGGGRILDAETIRAPRRNAGVLARLAVLAGAAWPDIVTGEVERAGAAGLALARLARLAGVSPAKAAHLLQPPRFVLTRAGVAVTRAALDGLVERLPSVLAGTEAAHPAGLAREQLRALLPDAGAAVLDAAVAQLVGSGVLRQEGGTVRVRRAEQESVRARQEAAGAAVMAELVRRGGLTPPDLAEVAPDPQARRLLNQLLREGSVVRAPDHAQKREIYFHMDAIETARRRLAPLLAGGSGLLVKEAGAALGISRKYSVPLLEYLDATGFTRRIADRRVLARPK